MPPPPNQSTTTTTTSPATPFLARRSPWTLASPAFPFPDDPAAGLLGSVVREEGDVYSLAVFGELLYAGSDSKTIRVWRGTEDFAGFSSKSGLVKAIAVATADGRVFTGHQDGNIRIWRLSAAVAGAPHRRTGTLPCFKDVLRSSLSPGGYVPVRRHRRALWLRHFDAVSCLAMDEEQGILYSGSWDKTFKVWRLSDSRCLESVAAHDDAVNAVAAAPDGLIFTGSADGEVKAWQRELLAGAGGKTRHVLIQVLRQSGGGGGTGKKCSSKDCIVGGGAVTAMSVGQGSWVYIGLQEGTVEFWEISPSSGNRAAAVRGGELRGHRKAVLCLAAAGKLLISGSADRTICVWRRCGEGGRWVHEKVAVLVAHEAPVKCLAVEEAEFAGGGKLGEPPSWVVYSGSLDRSVKVWRVSDRGVDGGAAVVLRTPTSFPESGGAGGVAGRSLGRRRRGVGVLIWRAARCVFSSLMRKRRVAVRFRGGGKR